MDCRRVLFSSSIPWSIGNSNLAISCFSSSAVSPELSKSLSFLSNYWQSPYDKLLASGVFSLPPYIQASTPIDSFTFLNMEIDGPKVVYIGKPFSINIRLFNLSHFISFCQVRFFLMSQQSDHCNIAFGLVVVVSSVRALCSISDRNIRVAPSSAVLSRQKEIRVK